MNYPNILPLIIPYNSIKGPLWAFFYFLSYPYVIYYFTFLLFLLFFYFFLFSLDFLGNKR